LAGARQLPLAADLLQCRYPILDMISGRQLVVFHCEHVDGHCLEALAGRLRSPELAYGCPGHFTAHYDLIAERLDILK